MADSVYRVTELVGTSPESWEQAAASAVETAAKTLRDLRIAEVVELDLQLEDGRVRAYRARVKVSFKYDRGGVPHARGGGRPLRPRRRRLGRRCGRGTAALHLLTTQATGGRND